MFRLNNGEIVEVNDNDVELSEFMTAIQTSVDPVQLIEEFIGKSDFKVVRDVINPLMVFDIKELNDPKKLNIVKDSIQELKESHVDKKILEIVTKVHKNLDEIFRPVVHRIKFLSDDVMGLIIEFLSIPCACERSDGMLDNLPYGIQGCAPGTPLSSLVNTPFIPYAKFIEDRSDDELLKISVAACLLGVKPLIILTGCKMAQSIASHTTDQIRNKYKIPEKFRDSVMDRISKVPGTDKWAAFVS